MQPTAFVPTIPAPSDDIMVAFLRSACVKAPADHMLTTLPTVDDLAPFTNNGRGICHVTYTGPARNGGTTIEPIHVLPTPNTWRIYQDMLDRCATLHGILSLYHHMLTAFDYGTLPNTLRMVVDTATQHTIANRYGIMVPITKLIFRD